jgi:hypothetical protein
VFDNPLHLKTSIFFSTENYLYWGTFPGIILLQSKTLFILETYASLTGAGAVLSPQQHTSIQVNTTYMEESEITSVHYITFILWRYTQYHTLLNIHLFLLNRSSANAISWISEGFIHMTWSEHTGFHYVTLLINPSEQIVTNFNLHGYAWGI